MQDLNIPYPKEFQLVQKDVATATGKMCFVEEASAHGPSLSVV
jgi:hypothetical protein